MHWLRQSHSALCRADDASDVSAGESADSGRLTLTATVLLPDGTPAANAVVHSHNTLDESRRTITANELGKISFQDSFLSGIRLHALSADGRNQALVYIPDTAVRWHVQQPATIQLSPAIPHHVEVTANGAPVEGAHVAVGGSGFRQTGITASDGTVVIWHPDGKISSVVAWHPELGVNGIQNESDAEIKTPTNLSLLKPGRHVVRVVDNEGNPVPDRVVTASVRLVEGGWILTREIDATRGTTNQNGETHFKWFPAEGLKYVDVDLVGGSWKVDDVDHSGIAEHLTIVHVRKVSPVTGKIILPDGGNAEGILITGFGFGPGDSGHLPRSRARMDGTFTMSVPSGHGYVLGVYDMHWASDLWSGSIRTTNQEPQTEITLKAYPATTAEIHVTRGSSQEPIANALVDVSRKGDVNWIDEHGEAQLGAAGIEGWVKTDKNGLARIGLGRGQIKLRLFSDEWAENKEIEVTSQEPIQIDFHRDWFGKRMLRVRPTTAEGGVFSPDLIALAWSAQPEQRDKIQRAVVNGDGTVDVSCDEQEVSLLLIDRKRHLSGFVKANMGDFEIDLPMQPTATLSGTLVAGRAKTPLDHRMLQLVTSSAFLDVVEPRQTDDKGNYVFTDVPAGVPIRLRLESEPEYSLFGENRFFEPGEQRTDDLAIAAITSGDAPAAPETPVEEIVAERLETCRVMGMRAVFILQGDDSESVKRVTEKISEISDGGVSARCLPLAVSTRWRVDHTESALKMGWTKPEAGEIEILIADGPGAPSSVRIACADSEAAVQQGLKFLEQHAPPVQDGRKKLEAAKSEAARSQRTLCVIVGGTRCGPCFRLARWIDRHRDVLEKDLVTVKLTWAIDEHTDEISTEIGADSHGIPFYVLMSPAGKVLSTSEGPLGNMGMPSTVEDLRHFRSMLETAQQRMTSQEIDELIESLREK